MRIINTMIKGIIVCLSASILSGCAGMNNGNFDCPGAPGVSCKSISEVNQLVDMGLMPETKRMAGIEGVILGQGNPYRRTNEEVLSVWIAPFEDGEGLLHQPGTVAAIVTPSKWEMV